MICKPKCIWLFELIINCTIIMKTKSRFSQNVYAIHDRIGHNKPLRHTTTEKYDNMSIRHSPYKPLNASPPCVTISMHSASTKVVTYLQNTHKGHPIAHPWVRHGVTYFYSLKADLYSAAVIPVLDVIYVGPSYDCMAFSNISVSDDSITTMY